MQKARQHNIVSIVREYSSKLLNFIRGRVGSNEDAEDILQDIWYQYSNIIDINEIDSISGWLFRVARNKITDRYRKKKDLLAEDILSEKYESGEEFPDLFSIKDGGPEMKQFKELFWEELMNALDELPENQRQVFIWNELEDMTLQEIADATNEKLKTIISRKGYAVKHLRKRLGDLYEELNTL
ncbi:MAG: sigma-70 family RNA polymerase sigma factor [Bacteroidetes bacterium]|nr:sigma-70 family RNA polymerase sigma factor [Bacteroidota bacterium]